MSASFADQMCLGDGYEGKRRGIDYSNSDGRERNGGYGAHVHGGIMRSGTEFGASPLPSGLALLPLLPRALGV